MKAHGVDARERERAGRTGADGNLRAGERHEAQRVLGHGFERCVARDRGDALDGELRASERERERQQVVEPGVGVDVHAKRIHGFASPKPASSSRFSSTSLRRRW